MPFIVATYVYASSQGQHTHSARTNFKSALPIRGGRLLLVRSEDPIIMSRNLYNDCVFSNQTSGQTASPELPLDPDTMKGRLVVEEDLLLQLFTVCRHANCGSAIDPAEVTLVRTGAALQISATCNNNHSQEWSSSASIGHGNSKLFVINVLLVSNICVNFAFL